MIREFHFSSLLSYMEEKRTYFAESTGNEINKLVSDLG